MSNIWRHPLAITLLWKGIPRWDHSELGSGEPRDCKNGVSRVTTPWLLPFSGSVCPLEKVSSSPSKALPLLQALGGDTLTRTALCSGCPRRVLGKPFHQNTSARTLLSWRHRRSYRYPHLLTPPGTGRARTGRGREGGKKKKKKKKRARERNESPVQTNCLRVTKIKPERVVPAVRWIWQL